MALKQVNQNSYKVTQKSKGINSFINIKTWNGITWYFTVLNQIKPVAIRVIRARKNRYKNKYSNHIRCDVIVIIRFE